MTATDRLFWRKARMWFAVGGLAAAAPLSAEPLPVAAPVHASTEAPVECNDSLYRFLPGEVNFCLAVRERQRNNVAGTLEMLKLAAGWGNKKAQYALGLMYFNGEQVAPNRPLGLAWLGLAAERGDATYAAVLASAYGKATPLERQQAQARYAALLPTYADAIAARRAQRRFDREMHELTRQEPYPSQVCIAGLTGGYTGQVPVCPSASAAVALLNRFGDAYFEGWTGHVTVGAPQPVRADDRDPSKQSPDAARQGQSAEPDSTRP